MREQPALAGKSFACEMADYKSWVSGLDAGKSRFLHMMVEVQDIDASLRFYVEGLGMKLLGRFDVEERGLTALFVGFEVGAAAVELLHRRDDACSGPRGSDYAGYIAIGVPDIDSAFAKLEGMGAQIVLRPAAILAGWPRVAFVKDPDGHKIELIQTPHDHDD